MKSTILGLLGLGLMTGPAVASVVAFSDQTDFVTQTGATLGTLPDLSNASLITIPGRLSIDNASPGGMTSGASLATFFNLYPNFLGKSGTENFDIGILATTYAFGFSLYEPTSPAPRNGCNTTCVESTFVLTLLSGAAVLDSFTVQPSNDTLDFYGYWSSQPITSVTIRETVGTDDNEFFGRFYTGARAPDPGPPPPVPEPGTLALVGLGLAGLGLARRRRADQATAIESKGTRSVPGFLTAVS